MAEETFRFLTCGWDIDRAKQLVGGREPTVKIPVAEYAPSTIGRPPEKGGDGVTTMHLGMIGVDWKRAETDATIDTDVPVIAILAPLGKDGGKAVLMIDGYHRLAKAVLTGEEELDAHLLTGEEERQVRDPRGAFGQWDKMLEEADAAARSELGS